MIWSRSRRLEPSQNFIFRYVRDRESEKSGGFNLIQMDKWMWFCSQTFWFTALVWTFVDEWDKCVLFCGGEPTSVQVHNPVQKAAHLSFTTTDWDDSFSLF